TPSVTWNLSGTPTNLGVVSMNDNPFGGSPCCGSTPTHDFGFQSIGTTVTGYFFLRNGGAASAQLAGSVTGASAFAFANGGGFPGRRGEHAGHWRRLLVHRRRRLPRRRSRAACAWHQRELLRGGAVHARAGRDLCHLGELVAVGYRAANGAGRPDAVERDLRV